VKSVDIIIKGACPLRATFFGLTSEYTNDVYRMIFQMKHHGNWGLHEIYALPVKLRDWYFQQLVDYFKEQNKAAAGQ